LLGGGRRGDGKEGGKEERSEERREERGVRKEKGGKMVPIAS